MKKLVLILLLLLLFFNLNLNADRYIKIGTIDFAYIFNNYTGTRQIKNELNVIRKQILHKIEKNRDNIKKLQLEYKTLSYKFSDMEKKWRFAELELNRTRLEEQIERFRENIANIENERTMPFKTELYLAAKKIAEQRGFSIIIDKDAFIGVDEMHNISNHVLGYLERKLRGELRE